jgi:hypothetical protein
MVSVNQQPRAWPVGMGSSIMHWLVAGAGGAAGVTAPAHAVEVSVSVQDAVTILDRHMAVGPVLVKVKNIASAISTAAYGGVISGQSNVPLSFRLLCKRL